MVRPQIYSDINNAFGKQTELTQKLKSPRIVTSMRSLMGFVNHLSIFILKKGSKVSLTSTMLKEKWANHLD